MSDWSSDVCSSDLIRCAGSRAAAAAGRIGWPYAVFGAYPRHAREHRQPRAAGTTDADRLAGPDLRGSVVVLRRNTGTAACAANRRGHTAARRYRCARLSAVLVRSDEHTSELQSLMRISY